MTTIVCNRSGMAADTRVTGPKVYYPAQKIFRIRESLFGTAGDGDMCLAFIDWVKKPRRKPMDLHALIGDGGSRSDVSILELNPAGIFRWTGWGFPERVLRDVDAIGSGAQSGLSALKCGKSLEDSIRMAIEHDEFTGCGIQVEYLEQPKKRGKR